MNMLHIYYYILMLKILLLFWKSKNFLFAIYMLNKEFVTISSNLMLTPNTGNL